MNSPMPASHSTSAFFGLRAGFVVLDDRWHPIPDSLNARAQRTRRLRRVRWSAKLDGCHLSWMETQILAHFKLHAVDLCKIP